MQKNLKTVVQGAPALLFDQLKRGVSPEFPLPVQVYNLTDLKNSILTELENLLNTIVGIPISELETQKRTVINYGFVDLSAFSPQSSDDRQLLATLLTQTISAYEPRLKNIRTTVEANRANFPTMLWARIEAELVSAEVTDPGIFPFYIQLEDQEPVKVFYG